MKLIFENWRKYLKEIERPGPGHTNSRYEQKAEPIAFDSHAGAIYDATGQPGGFLEEDVEEELEEVEPLPSPIDPVPFPDIKENEDPK